MMLQGHIDPCWDNSYRHLDYIDEVIKQPELQTQWIQAGHDPKNLIIKTYAQPNTMPDWVQLLSRYWKEYKNFGFSFHKFVPGNYLPEHKDNYAKYTKTFGVEPAQVVRILLYLEDWQPGQFNTVESQVIGNWKAGDWIGWYGDAAHSVVNFGLSDRYALAITCHKQT
jgi:hypothetical protein